MSLVLGAWVRDFTPASTHDQLVLLHICDEIQAPEATTEDSLPSGKFLGPPHQTQNRRKIDGGGFLSMADLGSRVWRDVVDPKKCSDRAIARTRRLRGLPNETGKAWFPALLWQVGGGPYQDEASGRIWNRRALWRVPLVGEAVLVPVPKSMQQTERPSSTGNAEERWRPDVGWDAAADLLLAERKARAIRAASEKAAAHAVEVARDRGVPIGATSSLAKAAQEDAKRRATEAWDARAEMNSVRAYLSAARAVQEDQVQSSMRVAGLGEKPGDVPDYWLDGGRAQEERLQRLAEEAAASVTRPPEAA